MQEAQAKAAVQIDENALDKECVKLPSDYLRYAFQAAEAKRDVAEAESSLSVVKADLARAIRSAPGDYGIDKITEAAIVSALETQPEHRKALAVVQDRRYEYDLAQAVVWALEHKKRSLTNLIELHGMSYFSNPKVTPAGREAIEQMTQRKVRRSREWEES